MCGFAFVQSTQEKWQVTSYCCYENSFHLPKPCKSPGGYLEVNEPWTVLWKLVFTFHFHKLQNKYLDLPTLTHTRTQSYWASLEQYWIFWSIWGNMTYRPAFTYVNFSAILCSFYVVFKHLSPLFTHLSLDLFLGVWCFLMIKWYLFKPSFVTDPSTPYKET